jgi:hypothetical protein
MVCDQWLADNGPPAPAIDTDYPYAGDLGLADAEVRLICPWAAELVALDGTPCWSVDDLGVAE